MAHYCDARSLGRPLSGPVYDSQFALRSSQFKASAFRRNIRTGYTVILRSFIGAKDTSPTIGDSLAAEWPSDIWDKNT